MRQNKLKIYPSISMVTPGLNDIIFIVVFILALASGSQMLSIDSDLGRHLTIGNYILDNRIIPAHDLFSYTLANQPRPPYEWLSQILLALTNRFLGLDGVILFTALIIAITFTLVFQFANRRSGSPIIAFLITLLAIGASSIHWLPRPHVITFLFLVIWIENLEQLRDGNRSVKLPAFPVIMLFWANLHGGFVFGFLAWFAYTAGWAWEKWRGKSNNQMGKKFLWIGMTSLITTIITPSFWHNWEAVLNNRSSFVLSRTIETMPPNLTTASVFPFTLLLALTVVLFFIKNNIPSASHFFLLVGLGVMSLLMARNIPLFALACIPILSEMTKTSHLYVKTWAQIEERFSGFGKQSKWYIIPVVVTFLTGTFFANQHFNKHQSILQFNPQVFPVQALDWVIENPQKGNMFNEFNWGGYILYRSWPGQQVFLDSQSDFYGEGIMRDYEQLMTTQGNWMNLLKKYQIDWVIIPTNSSLATTLNKIQDWKTVYKDGTTIIIHRHQ